MYVYVHTKMHHYTQNDIIIWRYMVKVNKEKQHQKRWNPYLFKYVVISFCGFFLHASFSYEHLTVLRTVCKHEACYPVSTPNRCGNMRKISLIIFLLREDCRNYSTSVFRTQVSLKTSSSDVFKYSLTCGNF
jgi:hypothetical protein